MSKGLEALEVFREYVSDFYEVKCFETIEKELKALELIKTLLSFDLIIDENKKIGYLFILDKNTNNLYASYHLGKLKYASLKELKEVLL